ncbi:glycosyltransferase [uncultured Gelidibacter sp.]|uniref:glycosyltransferase n=1 Tax=uncultured Gelidibacter sp. TaxID=259318 RepID=UPI002635CB02|nr:glycosyltransferase [uncultured Gelidibacter sp.]
MNQPRILIFASYFAPNSFSEALTNNKFALALKNNGFDVTVISTASYNGVTYEDSWSSLWEPLRTSTHNIPSVDINPKNRLIRKIKSILAMKHPINGVGWAHKAYKKAISLHNEKPFDFIISRSISDFGHLPALKFKKATGVRWAANWNDPPFFIFPEPYQEKTNFIDQFFYTRYIKDIASSADYNTFPSKRLFNYLQHKLGVFKDENSEILPHLNTALNLDTGIQKRNTFSICHAGNLSKERSPELFFKALRNLTEKYSTNNIECYIIGVEDVGLKALVNEFNLDEVVKITGAMPYKNTLEFLRTCSVGLLIEAKCEEGIFLPSKVSDYIQADLTIMSISPKIGTMKDILNEYGGGLVSDNTDAANIFQSLEILYLEWNKNKLKDFQSSELNNYLSENYMLNTYNSFLSKID